MRAVRLHEFGGPEVFKLEDVPTPQPGDGQVLIRLEATGVNFIEIYQREGRPNYQRPLPSTLGSEGAGIVEALGARTEASGLTIGDRVGCNQCLGAYASHALAPADSAVRLPEGVSTRAAAAVLLQGMTAHYLTHDTYPVGPGTTCLVHAAAGGVGLLLCQVAKHRGAARVIGTTSTEAKARLAMEAGADDVILYTQQDFVSEVKRITGGRGVDVVYDSVGADTFLKSMDCLRPRGYLVLFGQSSGPAPAIDPQILQTKGSIFLTRPTGMHHFSSVEDVKRRTSDLFRWLQEGALTVRVGEVFGLANAGEAHRALASRQTTGKLLLVT